MKRIKAWVAWVALALAALGLGGVVIAQSGGEDEWGAATTTITRYLSPSPRWWTVSVAPYTQNVDVVLYTSATATVDTLEVPAGFTLVFERRITKYTILRAVATDGIDIPNPARRAGDGQ